MRKVSVINKCFFFAAMLAYSQHALKYDLRY